jgi:NADPH:quinone reductase-like Zn-dependent oxidoreductase
MDDVLGYAGQRVIVSGAATPVGAATVALLVELGAEVHALGTQRPPVSGIASFTEVDLGDDAQIDAATDRIGAVVNALFHCTDDGPRRLVERVGPLMRVPGAAVATVTPTDAVPEGPVAIRVNTVAIPPGDALAAADADAGAIAWALVLLNSPRARAIAGAILPLATEPA